MPTYTTEIEFGGRIFCDRVDAEDWDSAQAICDERRPILGETVTGELVEVIEWEADDA